MDDKELEYKQVKTFEGKTVKIVKVIPQASDNSRIDSINIEIDGIIYSLNGDYDDPNDPGKPYIYLWREDDLVAK